MLLLLAYTGQSLVAVGAPCFMMSSSSQASAPDMVGMDHSGHDMEGMDHSGHDMEGMDHAGHDMSGNGDGTESER